MRFVPAFIASLFLLLHASFGASATSATFEFNVPAQSADQALLAFAKQAKIDILFSYEELRHKRSNAVIGRYDAEEGLEILLRATGYGAIRSGESKWIVKPTGPPSGTIKGKILAPDGSPARRVRVLMVPAGHVAYTNDAGDFEFPEMRPGRFDLVVTAPNCRPLQLSGVEIVTNRVLTLVPQTMQRADDPTRLDPYVVKGRATHASPLDHSDTWMAPRSAGGNLDLSRTESDALPYMIFNRSQIARSGVINLNEFLQRELIDSSAGTLPPEQNGNDPFTRVGSNNLSLRGFSQEETVILVNGRRLPEVITSGQDDIQPPDVNLIPLSLVQQVEVLPVSASSLYSGNAVGGVINIVLRPDVDANATEVNATYTNALGHFDAPQSALSLLHAHTLLGGKLRIRLNANFTRAVPVTEAEVGHRQKRATAPTSFEDGIYRATPNVRTVRPEILPRAPDFNGDDTATFPPSAPRTEPPLPPLPPLFGPGTSPVASVAPGADGSGGLAAFRGREGVRNLEFFDSAGRFSTGLDSLDFPYGREQERQTYYGSAVYDAFPWLQLALDATYSRTVMHRGYDVLTGDLRLSAASPLNPFHQDVLVTLNETAPKLGENYSEARLEFSSLVAGAIVKLPSEWRLSLDAQYANNLVKYRGLSGANTDRWQDLVNAGLYNPLRDTRVFGPPDEFYDRVLVYRAGRGRFATLGDYDTLDLAARVTNELLPLPTGNGVVNVGGDFRRNHLAKFTDERRFSDGTLATEPFHWGSRSLDRYSAFSEVQAPIVPQKWRPKWLQAVDTDLALRYVASNSARESNFAPTYGLKVALRGGFALRGSITTSTRFPTPHMSRPIVSETGGDGNASVLRQVIFDPVRNSRYAVIVNEVVNPDLQPESALTQTAGLVFQAGKIHRFRAAIDFVDTHKVNELTFIDAQQAISKEPLWPERVQRAAPDRGDVPGTGLIQMVTTSRANLATRYSQDWTSSLDYRWSECLGGTLEAYARILFFQRYRVRPLPNAPAVDELSAPDGFVPVLKYRANFGAAWSNKNYTFGGDGHYFHSRLLPKEEWEAQGSNRIKPFWQFDAFTQFDVARWLPWDQSRYGLRLQLRVNNLIGTPFPKYVNDAYGTGVQPYGDWRGRVYSVSLTATF